MANEPALARTVDTTLLTRAANTPEEKADQDELRRRLAALNAETHLESVEAATAHRHTQHAQRVRDIARVHGLLDKKFEELAADEGALAAKHGSLEARRTALAAAEASLQESADAAVRRAAELAAAPEPGAPTDPLDLLYALAEAHARTCLGVLDAARADGGGGTAPAGVEDAYLLAVEVAEAAARAKRSRDQHAEQAAREALEQAAAGAAETEITGDVEAAVDEGEPEADASVAGGAAGAPVATVATAIVYCAPGCGANHMHRFK